ncbi:hypothetical protein [Prosthecomicrobium hirschii]|uniref:hypothetical protein n=1 Tax=Prosthecodimorpha hirschii TaxID=665126 RepID=UPI0022210D04|nr:hypothetical protein [Prosthecomicrobium hirschii]MCW1844200.1 hypothetical protein [Prosthecomicrobium hirschii]
MLEFTLIVYIAGFGFLAGKAVGRNFMGSADWLDWVVSIVVAAAWPITLPIALDRKWRKRGRWHQGANDD